MRGLVTELFLTLPPTSEPEEKEKASAAGLKLGEILSSTVITLIYKDDSTPQGESQSGETQSGETQNGETQKSAQIESKKETQNESPSKTPLGETPLGETPLNETPHDETPPSALLDAQVGGLASAKRALQQLLSASLFGADRFLSRGIRPPRGILLFGPPGTGKTLLVRSLVSAYRLSFFAANLATLLCDRAGDSERQLASLFARARHAAPAILFLDEVDALCPPREKAGPVSARLCALLLSLFDGLTERVAVIGATNRWAVRRVLRRRPRGLDPALRRPGRFDREVEVEVPTVGEKRAILEVGAGAAVKRRFCCATCPMRSATSSETSSRSTPADSPAPICDSSSPRRSSTSSAKRHRMKPPAAKPPAAKRHKVRRLTVKLPTMKLPIKPPTKLFTVKRPTMKLTKKPLTPKLPLVKLPTVKPPTVKLPATLFTTILLTTTPPPKPPPNPPPKRPPRGCSTVGGLPARAFPAVRSALPRVRPSALREVSVVCPGVHWRDVGGAEAAKARLRELLEWPLRFARQFARFGVAAPRGVLLYGPPGCSKTLLAKAVATEAAMNFIAVKGPELFSKYVGESEQAVAEVFRKARLSAPCVIFFDEIDAFAVENRGNPHSQSARGSSSGVTERVVSQFLTELDGIHALKRVGFAAALHPKVLVIAATNRPDLLDPALLRPGRLDTHIFLGLPDCDARRKILEVHLAKVPCAHDVDPQEIARRTEGYSGAELAAVCSDACLTTLSENKDAENIDQKHLLLALEHVKARTNPELLKLYIEFNERGKAK